MQVTYRVNLHAYDIHDERYKDRHEDDQDKDVLHPSGETKLHTLRIDILGGRDSPW